MTGAQKLALCERVVQIVEDQMKLEKHFTEEKRGSEAIDFIRLNAYVQIVNAILGPGTMK